MPPPHRLVNPTQQTAAKTNQKQMNLRQKILTKSWLLQKSALLQFTSHFLLFSAYSTGLLFSYSHKNEYQIGYSCIVAVFSGTLKPFQEQCPYNSSNGVIVQFNVKKQSFSFMCNNFSIDLYLGSYNHLHKYQQTLFVISWFLFYSNLQKRTSQI